MAEGARFDIVVSNHVLHHLTAGQLSGLAADSAALASRVALHSDIARGRTAYGAYAVAITPFAPGSFLRTGRAAQHPPQLYARRAPRRASPAGRSSRPCRSGAASREVDSDAG